MSVCNLYLYRFEALLEEAMADCGPCKNVFSHDSPYDNHDDDGEKAEEESENEEESRTEFVPVISYISPSLARLVSPLSVMTRQEVKSSTTGTAKVLIFPLFRWLQPAERRGILQLLGFPQEET